MIFQLTLYTESIADESYNQIMKLSIPSEKESHQFLVNFNILGLIVFIR